MEKILTFADGTQKPVHNDTVIVPSGNPRIRSRLIIQAKDGSLANWLKLFNDETKLSPLTLTAYEGDSIVAEDELLHYTVVADVGRKLIESVDYLSGAVSTEYRLTATLEQLTETEQRLYLQVAEK